MQKIAAFGEARFVSTEKIQNGPRGRGKKKGPFTKRRKPESQNICPSQKPVAATDSDVYDRRIRECQTSKPTKNIQKTKRSKRGT
jgi:hypothetical protein